MNKVKLVPLRIAIAELISHEIGPGTQWRWATHGLAGIDGDRIKIKIWFVGRKPFTTLTAVEEWIEAVTAARMSRVQRTRESREVVSDEELRAAGLINTHNASPRNSNNDRRADGGVE